MRKDQTNAQSNRLFCGSAEILAQNRYRATQSAGGDKYVTWIVVGAAFGIRKRSGEKWNDEI